MGYYSPRIHPAVYNGIVHGVAHGQPVDGQVKFLDEGRLRDGRVAGCDYEVAVERQPADGEYQDDHNHHLHHLGRAK